MNWVHPACLLLATIVAVYLQSTLDGVRRVLMVQPDLLSPLVVYAALTTSLPTTTAAAVVGGLALDSLSAGPLGLSVLPLLALGLILHARRDVLMRESPWAQALLGGAGCLGVAVAGFGLLFVLWPLASDNSGLQAHLPEVRDGMLSLPKRGWGLVWEWGVVTVCGTALTPLVFRIFQWVQKTLQYRPVPLPGYRSDREIERGRF